MALQGSRPPNVYGGTGDFFGSGNPQIEVLQIDITGESGQITADGQVTSELSADWLQIIVKVDDQWTYSDSKNVYKVAGEIAYDLPEVETISSYDITVSGGGFGTASQSCTKP
jgi:hypothetical protein